MENITYYLNNISFFTYFIVFAGGAAVSFTPCVFPLVPIIVSVIGVSREKSRLKNFILSLSYVFGMAVMFSILGSAAALAGRLFGQVQMNFIAQLIIGNIMILFALTFLDVIPIPLFWLTRAGAGKIIKGGNVLSVMFMGFVSGFVASPCTASILAALLTYVAVTQNAVLGFSLLFVFAMGFGTVLIIIGTFTGILTNISRAESATRILQKAFGIMMILIGEYYIFKAGMLSL